MFWWIVAAGVVALLLSLRPKPFRSVYTQKDFENVDFKKVNIKEHLPPKTNAKYAVIGTGFVGTVIISQLLARGEEHIKAIDIAPTKKFDNNPRVQIVKANVMNLVEMKQHLKGVEVVYATFAIIKYWQHLTHNYKLSHDVNVIGTENVIEACLASDVKYLIQTSTSYVAIGYGQSSMGMTEKGGYAKQPINHYSTTKIIAEKAALAANNSKTKGGKTLITASIRPCSAVFGYGDVLNCSRLIKEDVKGFLPHQKLDYVYVENLALAHLLLEEKMKTNPSQVGGEAFCISNNAPISREQWYSMWKTMYPQMRIEMLPDFLPPIMAYISLFIQYIGKGKINIGELELLTPSTMANCGLSNSFNIEKAQRLLGYKPIFTVEEGVQKTIYSYLTEK